MYYRNLINLNFILHILNTSLVLLQHVQNLIWMRVKGRIKDRRQ